MRRRLLKAVPRRPATLPPGSAWSPQTGWAAPLNPARGRKHPADQGPPLEDLDKVIRRAEAAADLEWRVDHGELPWDWPISSLVWLPLDGQPDPIAEAMLWPRRWFTDHLFELPPLGVVPAQWLVLFG